MPVRWAAFLAAAALALAACAADPGPPDIVLVSLDNLRRDFVFVSDDLVPRVAACHADASSDASDHQAMVLTLGA